MDQRPSKDQKALQINLAGSIFGTFAEIGAGQEVARAFFLVGKAAGTVAKSISAYDMGVSTALYGPTDRYVCRQRLEAMLDNEYSQLLAQLDAKRGEHTTFFVYADTVATRSATRHQQGNGWLGVRFQANPREQPSEIIIHVVMRDTESAHEQECLGVIGVNLVYGAFYYHQDPSLLMRSLMDGLNRRRLEIDMIRFGGPAFQGLDNRLMSLQLVEQSLTDAALFTAAGEVVQPAEVLYGKPVLIGRGSFRPVTNVTLEMLESAARQFTESSCKTTEPVVLMEMTLKNLMSETAVDPRDFLARADVLGALGKMVMISNFSRFDGVTTYIRSYTRNVIAMILGLPTLTEIFDPKYYQDLDGGLLEGVSNLFRGPVQLLVMPTRSGADEQVSTPTDLQVAPELRHLYAYFLENGFIEPIREFDASQLNLRPADILARMQAGDPSWETMVPEAAVRVIKEHGYFGALTPQT